MQKRMVRMMVLVLFLLTAITPMVVDAGCKIRSRPFTVFHFTLNKVTNEDYDMVIIAPSSYGSPLEPFIEHKNNRGIVTKFVSLDDIYSGTYFEVQGRDNQEKIKYFIKDAIETWGITYVLFVGSFKQVPVRYCYNNDNYTNHPELKFVSELYYADIYNETRGFSSWDTNGDGIYGEWDGDKAEDKPIDLAPDVCLGRLACVDKGEVEIVVSKIINYEKQAANPSWFKRMVVVGGDTYDEYEGFEGEIYNQQAIDAMEGFTPVKLWASTGKLKNGLGIVREINKGCGFWYLSGHGNTNVWVTYTPDGSPVGKFNAYHMLLLFNKNKLPICLVGGCHNSKFAVSSYKYFKAWNRATWMRECWSWRLVSKPNSGSIATIGSTGLSWYSAEYAGEGTNWLNVQFFREYANDTVILGQIWKNALALYVDTFPINWETPSGGFHSINAKTVQEWALLGDPSLTIGGKNSNNVINRGI